ncbi:splicing factor 3B subunit 2-like [Olea europaea var. sylvestris]|uniref:splicing factor 3B subunit 2-like n=1 Tax=Olea europaea var. sylvestris TaxID=158386 RepID=UPI000C1D09D8|nr:splicing factor 3B subunit 2-like [Olea europaea var. sylvestris]
MPAEVAKDAAESRLYANGDLNSKNPSNTAAKKSRENERRRRRRKQKKNNKALQASAAGDDSDTAAEDGIADDSSKENSDPQKVLLQFLDVNFRVVKSLSNYLSGIWTWNVIFQFLIPSSDNQKTESSVGEKWKLELLILDIRCPSQYLLAYIEKEDSKKLKQKQREKMQPKMGKMDIDYQVLHDAFFKHQTKPKLTAHGDLYYEGKEFEVKLREMKPGMLSQELKEALGMPDGAPPPWLINMQRYGPPPSYPSLKIPGLNAPIPPGAKFGYGHGDWGKPPVDEYGRPLYGDVFGVLQQDQPNYEEEPVDKTKHWGDLEEEEEEEEEDEEEEEQIEEEELEDGIQSVDSLSSTPTGVETPDVIDLRKQQRKEPEKPLYQVLEEKEEKIAPGTLLGTSHTYLINTGTQDKTGAKRVDLLRGQKSDRVDVTLAPEELELMDNVLPAKYEEAREEEKLRTQKEDFSDMVAENEKKRKRKMQEKEGKSKKKDFKF